MKKFAACLLFVLIMFTAAFPAAFFPPGEWYASLNKPDWNPPSYLFGPVWSSLYVLIGIAGWRVWRVRGEGWARPVLILWVLQWILNATWSLLFFGLKSPAIALLEILLLWVTILAFLLKTRKHDQWATALFAPYLLWVSFATVLNATIWYLNR